MWSHHREHFRLGPHAIKILNLPTSDNGPFVLNALCLSNRGLLVEILQFSRQAHFSVAGSIGRQPISLVKLLFCVFRICTIFLFCDSATILTSHLGKKTLIGKTMWGKQRVANRYFWNPVRTAVAGSNVLKSDLVFCVCSFFVPLFPFKSNTLSPLFCSISNHNHTIAKGKCVFTN